MDIKEYISSGILESVALGLASKQEVQEVQCMKHIYPEIQEEYAQVESTVEKMAFDTAIPPAPHLKASVLAAISREAQESAASKEGKIVQMPAASGSANPWKMMAAAAMVLFIGAAALWVSSNNKSNSLSDELATIRSEQSKNQQVMLAMALEQDRVNAIHTVMTEGSTRDIMMSGTPMEPEAAVKVMWSANGKKAIMMAKTIAPPPTDMQYQLWAIADGKPVSLGVFDYDEVTNITEPFEVAPDNITAFAITLEKRGGSATPTMENMVVIGNV